jgi:hypothetical protein
MIIRKFSNSNYCGESGCNTESISDAVKGG